MRYLMNDLELLSEQMKLIIERVNTPVLELAKD
jgi:hypothetical protein